MISQRKLKTIQKDGLMYTCWKNGWNVADILNSIIDLALSKSKDGSANGN